MHSSRSHTLSPYTTSLQQPITSGSDPHGPIHYSLNQRFDKDENYSYKTSWAELSFRNQDCQSEAAKLTKLAIPIGFSLATTFLQLVTDQAIVGHLGTKYLAASSLAAVLKGIFQTFIFSFCETINILCSQAYGAKNFALVAEWMQLGCFLSTIVSIPAFFGNYYCENILVACGAPKHFASLSGRFARWSMISIWPGTQFVATSMYFRAQSIVLPTTCISAMMVIFNLLVNLMLVYGYGINWLVFKVSGNNWNGMGFIGSPISTAITRTTQYGFYMFYMFYWKKYHTIHGAWTPFKLSTFSLTRIKTFVIVAIPQTISTALEEWQIQIIALFAAHLDDADLAAFSSAIMVFLLCHAGIIGLGEACRVRVGNLLGANNPRYAQYVAWVGITMGVTCGTVIGVLLAFFGKYIAYMVSGKQEIFDIYEDIFPIVGALIFLLSEFTIIAAVLIAQARTVGLAIGAVVGCWLVSVPLSYLLGIYFDYGITGIWYGIGSGYIIFGAVSTIIFYKTNWTQCAMNAAKRSRSQNKTQNEQQEHNNNLCDSLVSGANTQNNDESVQEPLELSKVNE